MDNPHEKFYTLKTFLDKEGYSVSFEEFPKIFGTGKTRIEAFFRLMVALTLALKTQEIYKNKELYDLHKFMLADKKHKKVKRAAEKNRMPKKDVEKGLDDLIKHHGDAIKELANR